MCFAQRNPAHPKFFLTVGDWSAKVIRGNTTIVVQIPCQHIQRVRTQLLTMTLPPLCCTLSDMDGRAKDPCGLHAVPPVVSDERTMESYTSWTLHGTVRNDTCML
eukprot:GHVS01039978.1.p2 GENE.GHVS01039978.1~~GHVS01039978.1.p2  ORF type:complete len:105 (+),score=6.31 GHVS01039978.1:127-441(+)